MKDETSFLGLFDDGRSLNHDLSGRSVALADDVDAFLWLGYQPSMSVIVGNPRSIHFSTNLFNAIDYFCQFRHERIVGRLQGIVFFLTNLITRQSLLCINDSLQVFGRSIHVIRKRIGGDTVELELRDMPEAELSAYRAVAIGRGLRRSKGATKNNGLHASDGFSVR